jgi:hypothetical protein
MKKIVCIAAVLLAVSMGYAAYPGTVLFSDSYNRPNATDIDASSVGMAGPLAPLVYVENFEGSGQATSIQILNNQLNVAMGVGMSSLYLDHNFIDASILASSGFSVSLDVVGITAADDTGNRFGGFGVGNTRAQAQAAGDSFDSAAPLRPSTARANQGIGVSDFYVDLALDQNLRVWSKGALLETIAVGAAAGTIRVDFYVSSFTAGSSVMAEVYFNGVKRSTRTFTWDFTDANYLGISGRTAAAGVFLDNLTISTLYSDKANSPVPGDRQIGVEPATVVLQWNKGKNAAGAPNAAIAQHYLYLVEGEPNFAGVSPITVADTADPISYNPASIGAGDFDNVYYWRVDESVNGSLPSDPNTLVGLVWSFETLKSIPIITSQPVNVLATAGQTAEFTIAVSSISLPAYQWFKSIDNAINTPGDDIPVGQAETLSLVNVQVSDEGYYFCKVTNSGGEASAQYSTAAQLGVKRIMAHWTLDAADFQGGQYRDVSGNGHHAEPNLIPEAAQFVPGAAPAKTGEALDMTVKPLAAAQAGEWAPSVYTRQVTVSAWVKWAGPNGAWQGVVSNRVTPTNGNFFLEIRNDNSNIQIGSPAFASGALQGPNLPVGQWAHLAVTTSTSGVVIYINGIAVATRSPASAIGASVAPMYLGALGRDAVSGVLNSLFNGAIDDVRIYNYAKDRYAVADLYYEVLETPVCLNPDNVSLRFDVAGGGLAGDQPDCKVNLVDFAVFAQSWLNCGYYPQSECQH